MNFAEDTTIQYTLVYSILHHEFLGFLIEPHLVALGPQGKLTLKHKRLYSHTAQEYDEFLDYSDYEIIKLLEECSQDFIIKKYYKKAIKASEYFPKHYDAKVHEIIRPYIEKKLLKVLPLLAEKPLYIMSSDGFPAEKPVFIAPKPAKLYFNFKRNEFETHYFPTMKYENERIVLYHPGTKIITHAQAWVLSNGMLYYFNDAVDGKKLVVFTKKNHVVIPKSAEVEYFSKFMSPLIEHYRVFAEGGLTINYIEDKPQAVLSVLHHWTGHYVFSLSFMYNGLSYYAGKGNEKYVDMKQEANNYVFNCTIRDFYFENNLENTLLSFGLQADDASIFTLSNATTLNEAIAWLSHRLVELNEAGIEVNSVFEGKRIFLAKPEIKLTLNFENDWFDIYGTVIFGEFEIPFIELRNHILKKNREYVLPNGLVAIIPEEWFAKYSPIFALSVHKDQLKLRKQHVGLLKEFIELEASGTGLMDDKLRKLLDFEVVQTNELPKGFKATLRDYQKAGYDWFMFLKNYGLGGCLADDMGLGKTVQTLALLQNLKEEVLDTKRTTSLIIMPTSLIYNWQNEAVKFAPELKVMVHAGADRAANTMQFSGADIVLTTYGTMRNDVEMLENYPFNYLILDESHIIKNPDSKTYHAVCRLQATNRLVLTGTPIENSLTDLWAQLNFVNEGLLGGRTYFNQEFVIPIEKNKNVEQAEKLQKLLKPFILRRTKQQVATELPDKIEQVYYCEMSETQAKCYEKSKNQYRNHLIEMVGKEGVAKAQFHVLQGLNELRQIANHPVMVQPDYEGESGKFTDVWNTLQNVLAEGHKVLIFSSYVKHLTLFSNKLKAEGTPFSWLSGQTNNRQEVVENFKNDENTQIFLISLKAGGVGLNLTEADYVFILDPWWNPAAERQATDRSHRIGQKKTVFVYRFITRHTVEEKILALQNRKKELSENIITIEEDFEKRISVDDIKMLFE